MTLAIAGTRRDAGVSVAEVNLKLIWDVVSQIKVGEHGNAYVVGAQGRLIAHPDISLVLRNTDMSNLAQVKSARAGAAGESAEVVQEAKNIQGREVLTASAPVPQLGWLMFVELPAEEAYAPLYAAFRRLAFILLAALVFAVVSGIFLARRMVGPIQALQAGAARIGSGDLSQRISIKTGDELEGLADQFNEMAGRLEESYAGLEEKVEVRTRELAQSVAELTALGEVTRAVSSTLDLETLLSTIVAKAVELSGTDGGAVWVLDPATKELQLRATYGMSRELIGTMSGQTAGLNTLVIGDTVRRRAPVQIADLRKEPPSPIYETVMEAGFLAVLTVPLIHPDGVLGALVIRRKAPRRVSAPHDRAGVDLCRPSRLAIENVRLFKEVQEKSRELEIASHHKSQFLANMSHELRTPLNAIIGLTECVTNTPRFGTEKAIEPLRRVHRAGTHLLGLINQVLDLSKIEAGKLELNPESVSIPPLVDEVVGTARQLAEQNGNSSRSNVPPICADHRRSDAAAADPAQSAQQRLQVHQGWRGALPSRRASTAHSVDRIRRARHRHRHDAGTAGEAVPGVHPGGIHHRAAIRRHRSRPRHHAQACPHDGWRRRRDKRSGQGLGLHGAAAGLAAESRSRRSQRAQVANGNCILVIDDDATARELINEQLKSEGFAVATAAGGSKASSSPRNFSRWRLRST